MDVIMIPIDLINLDEAPISDNSYESELIHSIKLHGILQPIHCLGPGADSKYKIIFGRRRVKAARLLGITEVPATIEKHSFDAETYLCIEEDLCRKHLSCKAWEAYWSQIEDGEQLSPETPHEFLLPELSDLLGSQLLGKRAESALSQHSEDVQKDIYAALIKVLEGHESLDNFRTLRKRLLSAEEERDKLKKELQAHQNVEKEIKERIELYKKDLEARMKEKYRPAMTDISEVPTEIEAELKQEIEDLQREIRGLDESLRDKSAENEASKEKIGKLTDTVATLETEIKAGEVTMKEFRDQVWIILKDFSSPNHMVERLESITKDLSSLSQYAQLRAWGKRENEEDIFKAIDKCHRKLDTLEKSVLNSISSSPRNLKTPQLLQKKHIN